ncbi:pheromone-binding protein-related protein 6 [Leptinotarsa decemlineata]|uniref:pheromone-binding protein-related protein 6 n=1 Tax=Leptinotarsa decemlineata TaxID=7539 RepID=UPI000C2550E7|nr:pheromone-binding protein-related protein 6-like [Leptinotarsa decemlineata]
MSSLLKVMLMSFLISSSLAYLDIKDFGEPMRKAAEECHDICTDVTGTTDEQVQQIREGNFIDDEKMKRYILCLWRVAGYMDRNLKINVAKVRQVLPQELIDSGCHSAAVKCLNEARNSGLKENYEKIYELEKCLYKIDPQKFVMF